MKFSLAAITLALAGAMAFPTTTTDSAKRQDTRYPYAVNSLSLRRLTDNTFNINVSLGWYSESGEIKESTACFAEWNPTPPPTTPVKCADPAFEFWFPSGIKNLEEYEIAVNGPDGKAQGEIVKGPKYECGVYEGPIEGIWYECRVYNGGAFYLPLV